MSAPRIIYWTDNDTGNCVEIHPPDGAAVRWMVTVEHEYVGTFTTLAQALAAGVKAGAEWTPGDCEVPL